MNIHSHDYLDHLYAQYLADPSSVAPQWRSYFQQLESGAPPAAEADGAARPPAESALDAASVARRRPTGAAAPVHEGTADLAMAHLQDRVDQLIRGFRVRGHLEAQLDPLGIPRPTNRELDPETFNLSSADLDKVFSTRTIYGDDFRTLRDIVQHLRATYCRSIGAQFMHIDDHVVRQWLEQRMESTQNRITLSRAAQVRILTRLTDAVIFEEFMRRRFIGAKTFSLEGAETLIPLLDLAIEKAGQHEIKEIVMGMAHRGRLNVLANILGKRSENIFWSFEDPSPEEHRGAGDVLYHMGHSTDWTTSSGRRLHISLCFNPSHLEFVNAVALGRCRAKQDRIDDRDRSQVMTILIHGDAAFIGEGIVQETLNLSQLAGYRVGGTLHVIVNNQLGFTTSAEAARSTTYCSDVAKMLQIPIFHVNGEDPEAVAQVVELAMEFRRRFQRDVVIDMYCYRRLGHNESDEPRFTQPVMYRAIDARPTIRDSYLEHLLKLEGVTKDEADAIAQRRRQQLQQEFDAARQAPYRSDTQSLGGYWGGYYGGAERDDDDVDTGVPTGKLSYVMRKAAELPAGFAVHDKLAKALEARRDMADGRRNVDWATAELAALGTLAIEGHPVRLTGQDTERGTFSQRHAVLYDNQTGRPFTPLNHLAEGQAPVEIINSPLSEAGVLGFEYGYSLDRPEGLVMWEAQFGDFWNAAQVIVDQFIASAEDKWRRLSGLAMLLPHGFEGAGPEHSSARLERFLTLAAESNIQVVQPTTAAQYFHVLRRQVIRPWRKPLIVMTPKSLLRDDMVSSNMQQLTRGRFQRVLGDPALAQVTRPERIVLATGKVAIDLIKLRDQQHRDDIAIVRLEQLYPLDEFGLIRVLSAYPDSTPIVWVQEEPQNMGAWSYIKMTLGESIAGRWPLVGRVCRPPSASPSTGSKNTHKIEQEELFAAAFDRSALGVA